MTQKTDYKLFKQEDFDRFEALIREDEREQYKAKLLESVGEPTRLQASYIGVDVTVYTADQVAAAVLAERERCAKVCDQYRSNAIKDFKPIENSPAHQHLNQGLVTAATALAYAIRGATT